MRLTSPIRQLAGLAAKPVGLIRRQGRAADQGPPDEALDELEAAADGLEQAAARFVKARDRVSESTDRRREALARIGWADKLASDVLGPDGDADSEESESPD